MTVEQFRFEGNAVYRDQELEAVVAPYRERELTIAELIQASVKVTEFYVEQGYITSGAFIPPEINKGIESKAAIVTIQVVEGKVERINLTGGDRLQKYVRNRLRSATTPALNQNKLLEALQLLQVDPLVKGISAQISRRT